VQLKLFISLSFPTRAHREETIGGEVRALQERKIIEVAAQVLGKSLVLKCYSVGKMDVILTKASI
jgi:hypothetical protein